MRQAIIRRGAGPALRLLTLAALGVVVACEAGEPPGLEVATSARALVQTVDGVWFYGPLGTAPVPTSGPFDATLLGRLRVVLEWTEPAGIEHSLASFDAHTSPPLVLARTNEFYLVNVPAAPWLTDPSLPYRFRVLLDGAELGRADVPAQVFAVLATNPSFTVGVRFRIDRRPAPSLAAISPTEVTSGAGGVTITSSGGAFSSDSVVRLDGRSYSTRAGPDGTRLADLPGDALTVLGPHAITVFTPSPGGGESEPRTLTVLSERPVLSSLAPAQVRVGSGDLALTLEGSGFLDGATVLFGEVELAATRSSAAELVTTLPALLLGSSGVFEVSVLNPAPSVGPSASIPFTLTIVVPTVTAITQDATFAGTGGLTVTLLGRDFLPGAVATFADTPLATTYVSETELTAELTDAMVAAEGTYGIAATNPAPGGGRSAEHPFLVLPLQRSSRLAGGLSHSCVVHPDRTLWCLGSDWLGELGDGAWSWRVSPAPVSGLAGVREVTAGNGHTCAALVDGSAYCWGDDRDRQLGGEVPAWYLEATNTPQAVAIPSAVVTLSAGAYHTCALDADGTVWCWGDPSYVELFRTSSYGPIAAPTRLPGLTDAVQLTARGFRHGCAVRRDGRVSCWGEDGLLGAPPDPSAPTPDLREVPGLTHVAAIASAEDATCALRTDGTVWCWGDPATGIGGYAPSQVPNLAPAVGLAAGGQLACAIERAGTVRCWGAAGALGDGTSAPSPFSPVLVRDLEGAEELAAGAAHALARRTDGTYVAWGDNALGQLGDGTQITRLAPVAAAFDSEVILPNIVDAAPLSAPEGHDVVVTISGSWFEDGLQVTFDGTPVSTLQPYPDVLMATIPAALLALGDRELAVSNPPPQGGITRRTFHVFPTAPTVSSASPSSAPMGSPDLVVTLAGAGFSSATTVELGTVRLAVQSASSTQVTAVVPASLLATARSDTITAYSEYPLGGSTITFRVLAPTPVLTALSQASIPAGSAHFTLTVSGSSFVRGSHVFIGNLGGLITSYVSSTELEVYVPGTAITASGTWPVSVYTVYADPPSSNSLAFSVSSGVAVSWVHPSSLPAGSSAVTLTIGGRGFDSTTTVTFGGQPITVRSPTSTTLHADVPASLLRVGGWYPIVVSSPSGGSSEPFDFTVLNPRPAVTSVSPASATTGGPDLALTIRGDNFVSGAVVDFFFTAVPTTFVSATELRAEVPARLTAAAGIYNVGVANPAPMLSNAAVIFYVYNRTPFIAAVSPSSAIAGTERWLTISGAAFAWNSRASLSGESLTTTYVSSSELRARVPSTVPGGHYALTVTNAAPVVDPASTSVDFTLLQPAPALDVLEPASVLVGQPTTVVLRGSSFVPGARVTLGGTELATTFVSSAELEATLPAHLVAAAGVFDVVVTNPEPGSPASAGLAFAVVNPRPVLTAISPASVPASFEHTLTLSGGPFAAGSYATLDGDPIATTFVSDSELRATVPGPAIWRPGTYTVAVVTEAPGGGTSAAILTAAATNAPVTIQSYLETCAVADDGSARCAGSGTYGGLGDGRNTSSPSPVTVLGLTGLREVGAAWNRACGLLASGEVWCWGYNGNGGLGNGSTATTNVPVSTGLTNAIELSTSRAGDHTCARLGDTTVRCWGLNSAGQLGDGTTTSRRTPTPVAGLSGVRQLTTGAYHTCALVETSVWCWGQNTYGQLGDGTTTSRRAPTPVAGLTGAVEVAAGAYHTCARLAGGAVSCWGHNGNGQAGIGYAGPPILLPSLVPGATGTVQLTAGVYATCARYADATARCWGQNHVGQLGDGTTTARSTPTSVLGLADVREIRGGGTDTTCARTGSGVYCWGSNTNGQLGDGTTTNRPTPTWVAF